MGENSKIQWTDHTFNPWIGCEKISPGCERCYAETWAKRTGQAGLWTGARQRTTNRNWEGPIRWNRLAEAAGVRYKVFCASLADVFDNQVPPAWRDDLWSLIRATPRLDWLLLTKRAGNIAGMLPADWPKVDGYSNVWLGATVVNQEEADRDIPKLLQVPAASRFLSCEPLLGPIDLFHIDDDEGALRGPGVIVEGRMTVGTPADPPEGVDCSYPGVEWVIIGGESGPHAREMDLEWARSLVAQCRIARVSPFVKQLGSAHGLVGDSKGGDIDRFPDGLRVREFPA